MNFLALLGWSYDDKTTVMTPPELIERFSLERVGASPATFDYAKLDWLNGVYLRGSPARPVRRVPLLAWLREQGFDWPEATVRATVPLIQEKLEKLSQYPDYVRFLFEPVTASRGDPATCAPRPRKHSRRSTPGRPPRSRRRSATSPSSSARSRARRSAVRLAITGSNLAGALREPRTAREGGVPRSAHGCGPSLNRRYFLPARARDHIVRTRSEEAFRRHYDHVFRFVRRRTPDEHQAEELTQAVFADAARGLESFKPGATPVLAWLYTVAQRRLADRSRGLTRDRRLQDAAAGHAMAAPDVDYGADVAGALRSGLERLPRHSAGRRVEAPERTRVFGDRRPGGRRRRPARCASRAAWSCSATSSSGKGSSRDGPGSGSHDRRGGRRVAPRSARVARVRGCDCNDSGSPASEASSPRSAAHRRRRRDSGAHRGSRARCSLAR